MSAHRWGRVRVWSEGGGVGLAGVLSGDCLSFIKDSYIRRLHIPNFNDSIILKSSGTL